MGSKGRERSPEIEALVVAWFAAASRGEPSLARERIAPGPMTRLIGSDPDEMLRGGDAVRDFILGEIAGAAGRVRFEARNVEAFSEGNMGWAQAQLVISLPDGQRITPRWSAAFRLQDGIWRFVQIHASIAVTNDGVGWVYPD